MSVNDKSYLRLFSFLKYKSNSISISKKTLNINKSLGFSKFLYKKKRNEMILYAWFNDPFELNLFHVRQFLIDVKFLN